MRRNQQDQVSRAPFDLRSVQSRCGVTVSVRLQVSPPEEAYSVTGVYAPTGYVRTGKVTSRAPAGTVTR